MSLTDSEKIEIAKMGAQQALKELGLGDPDAIHDIHDMRDMLTAFRMFKGEMIKSVARGFTIAIFLGLCFFITVRLGLHKLAGG